MSLEDKTFEHFKKILINDHNFPKDMVSAIFTRGCILDQLKVLKLKCMNCDITDQCNIYDGAKSCKTCDKCYQDQPLFEGEIIMMDTCDYKKNYGVSHKPTLCDMYNCDKDIKYQNDIIGLTACTEDHCKKLDKLYNIKTSYWTVFSKNF